MATRKEPEVIFFQEPSYNRHQSGKEAAREKSMFLRGDVSEIFHSNPALAGPERNSKTKAEPSSTSPLDLKATLREVQSLAASSFTGKTKRKFEEDQIRALGAKPPKSEYVPYPHYQMVARAKQIKEKRLAEEVLPKRKKKKDRGTGVRGKGRWKESTKSLEPALGKFRKGVLTLNSKDLAKVRT